MLRARRVNAKSDGTNGHSRRAGERASVAVRDDASARRRVSVPSQTRRARLVSHPPGRSGARSSAAARLSGAARYAGKRSGDALPVTARHGVSSPAPPSDRDKRSAGRSEVAGSDHISDKSLRFPAAAAPWRHRCSASATDDARRIFPPPRAESR